MVIIRIDFDGATPADAKVNRLHDLERRVATLINAGFSEVRGGPVADSSGGRPGFRFEVDFREGLTTSQIEAVQGEVERHVGVSSSRTTATCRVSL